MRTIINHHSPLDLISNNFHLISNTGQDEGWSSRDPSCIRQLGQIHWCIICCSDTYCLLLCRKCLLFIYLQVMLEHVNLTVGERWEDDMTKFWYEVRKLGRDDVVEVEKIKKGKVISDNVDRWWALQGTLGPKVVKDLMHQIICWKGGIWLKLCSEILDRMYGGTDEAGSRDLRWANFGFQQVWASYFSF